MFDELLPATFEAAVELPQKLGNRNLIVPGLPHSYRQSWRGTVGLFSYLAEKLAPFGVNIGHQNRAAEPHNGERH